MEKQNSPFYENSKKRYYKKLLTENVNNSHSLWKILKNLLPSDPSPSSTTLIYNDEEIVNPKQIGDLFSSYFASATDNPGIVSTIDQNSDYVNVSNYETSISIPNTTIHVIQALKELDANKSAGLDDIPAYFIRTSANSTAPIVLRLCNLSISTGIFPAMWKKPKLIL